MSYGTHTCSFKVENNIVLMVTVCIASFEVTGELQRERLHHSLIHVPQHLAGMDERVDNSCKWRAEYFRRSLVIVCREHGQWQASFIQQKSASITEVSVTEQILREFPNSQKSWEIWACTNSVYQALIPHPRTSLRTRCVCMYVTCMNNQRTTSPL